MELAAGLPDGRAELCCGPIAVGEADGIGPATAPPQVAGLRCMFRAIAAGLNGSGGEGGPRIGANALDHGTEAIRTLRRQVLS